MALSSRIEPYGAPPFEACGRCGWSEEDHGTRENGAQYVFCPCQPCRGSGQRLRYTFARDTSECSDCNGSGFSEDTFAASERTE